MPWLFILGRGWGCRGGCFSPVVSRFTFTSLTGLVRYIYPKLAEEQCTLVERETFFVDNWSMLDIVWFVDALSYLSWWFQSFFPPVSGRFNGHQAALESIEMAKHAAEAWITGRMRMSWNCLIQRTLWQLGAYKTTGPYRCKVSAMAATVSSWLDNPGWSDDVRGFSQWPFKRNMIGFRGPACLKRLRIFLFHLMFVKEQKEHKRHQHTLLMKKESTQK